MAKKGLQNEEYLKDIKRNGSNALNSKNEFGVNVFDKDDTSTGLISGKLIRPRYNEQELLKSVDTDIVELLPRERPELPDTVLRSVYNVATASINELTLQVEGLESEVNTLSSKIESLHATTESLRRDLDGVNLAKSVVDNQLFISQESFSIAQTDLQIALQNGTQEAIQRVSLTARNESLQQELELLREQLFGRTAQVAAGAETINELVTVRNLTNTSGEFAVYATALKDSNNGDVTGKVSWKSGEKFEIVNSGTESVTVRISNVWPITQKALTSNEDDVKWYKVPSSITVAGGEQKTVTLTQSFNELNTVSDVRPTGAGSTRNYDGSITFTIGTDEIKFNTRLRKARKASKL